MIIFLHIVLIMSMNLNFLFFQHETIHCVQRTTEDRLPHRSKHNKLTFASGIRQWRWQEASAVAPRQHYKLRYRPKCNMLLFLPSQCQQLQALQWNSTDTHALLKISMPPIPKPVISSNHPWNVWPSAVILKTKRTAWTVHRVDAGTLWTSVRPMGPAR